MPANLPVVCQREQIASFKEADDSSEIDHRRQRGFAGVVVVLSLRRRVEILLPQFFARVQIERGDVTAFFLRSGDRRDKHAVAERHGLDCPYPVISAVQCMFSFGDQLIGNRVESTSAGIGP